MAGIQPRLHHLFCIQPERFVLPDESVDDTGGREQPGSVQGFCAGKCMTHAVFIAFSLRVLIAAVIRLLYRETVTCVAWVTSVAYINK